MLKPTDKYTTPPDGWRYLQRESGKLIRGTSFTNLLAAVREHRMANGYPIQMDMEQEVEAGVCEQSPSICVEVEADLIPHKTNHRQRAGLHYDAGGIHT